MALASVIDDSADAALRECLERSRLLDAGITRLHRARLDTSTSYETSVLTTELEDGRTVNLFLKDYGISVRPKDELDQRRDREMRFYRDLAPDGELGTPKYYGSVWDPACGRHWLLLEFVGGKPVKHCSFEKWVSAAGWLGRMHGYFWQRRERLDKCDFLERHDASRFRLRVERAVRAVFDYAPELGDRLRAAVAGYDQVIDAMLEGPCTLLHGGFHALNVLTELPGDADRFCVIDWEEAGIGPGLSDLSYFTNGFQAERFDQLLAAYCEGAGEYDLPLPDKERMVHVMKCFRLQKLIQSLPKYAAWNNPAKTMPKLVGHAETYARDVQHEKVARCD